MKKNTSLYKAAAFISGNDPKVKNELDRLYPEFEIQLEEVRRWNASAGPCEIETRFLIEALSNHNYALNIDYKSEPKFVIEWFDSGSKGKLSKDPSYNELLNAFEWDDEKRQNVNASMFTRFYTEHPNIHEFVFNKGYRIFELNSGCDDCTFLLIPHSKAEELCRLLDKAKVLYWGKYFMNFEIIQSRTKIVNGKNIEEDVYSEKWLLEQQRKNPDSIFYNSFLVYYYNYSLLMMDRGPSQFREPTPSLNDVLKKMKRNFLSMKFGFGYLQKIIELQKRCVDFDPENAYQKFIQNHFFNLCDELRPYYVQQLKNKCVDLINNKKWPEEADLRLNNEYDFDEFDFSYREDSMDLSCLKLFNTDEGELVEFEFLLTYVLISLLNFKPVDRENLNRIKQFVPDKVKTIDLLQGLAFYKNRDYEKAYEYLKPVLTKKPVKVLSIVYVHLLVKMNKVEEAIAFCKSNLKKESARSRLLKGWPLYFFQKLSTLEEWGKQDFPALIQIVDSWKDPLHNAFSLICKMGYYLSIGNYAESVDCHWQYVSKVDGYLRDMYSDQAFFYSVQLTIFVGDYERANKYLVDHGVKNPKYLYLRAMLNHLIKNEKSFIEFAQKAIDLGCKEKWLLDQLAEKEFKAKNQIQEDQIRYFIKEGEGKTREFTSLEIKNKILDGSVSRGTFLSSTTQPHWYPAVMFYQFYSYFGLDWELNTVLKR